MSDRRSLSIVTADAANDSFPQGEHEVDFGGDFYDAYHQSPPYSRDHSRSELYRLDINVDKTELTPGSSSSSSPMDHISSIAGSGGTSAAGTRESNRDNEVSERPAGADARGRMARQAIVDQKERMASPSRSISPRRGKHVAINPTVHYEDLPKRSADLAGQPLRPTYSRMSSATGSDTDTLGGGEDGDETYDWSDEDDLVDEEAKFQAKTGGPKENMSGFWHRSGRCVEFNTFYSRNKILTLSLQNFGVLPLNPCWIYDTCRTTGSCPNHSPFLLLQPVPPFRLTQENVVHYFGIHDLAILKHINFMVYSGFNRFTTRYRYSLRVYILGRD
jgi:hypothetical protein